jgi:diphosphomevalonate decarboxylase
VVLLKSEPKQVSSSDAHSRVRTSPLWEGRIERAESRVRNMTVALRRGDLVTVARISWSEAWEMHSLFHTCVEPFSYWEPGTIELLHWLTPKIRESSPPIVTLDAGPNIHILVDQKDRDRWLQELRENFSKWNILEDEAGEGARPDSLE